MKIRVLGCSGAIAAGCKTTAFLLDDDVLVDAGSGVNDLTLDELVRIDHILLSHSHLDHVLSVALLADSVIRQRVDQRRPPIVVHALAPTIDALRQHVFNGTIWPDFGRLPSAEHPVLRFEAFEQGQTLQLGQRQVEVLSANHTVPAVGFAIRPAPVASASAAGSRAAADEGDAVANASDRPDDGPWWVFTGDTGPNPALWARLRTMRVAHLVIETAFSDAERQLAKVSRHLCPSTLEAELAQLGGTAQIHITHIKPGEQAAVMAQVEALALPHRIRALEAGQILTID